MRNFMIVLGVGGMLLLAQQGTHEPIPSNVTNTVSAVRVDEETISKVISIAKIPHDLAAQIVGQAEELAYKDFPKKSDILSVIAVESMFNNDATDGLGSCGLTQVNSKANNLDASVVCTLPMTNMEHGVRILRSNYEKLGDKRSALLAYNVGMRNFLRGNYNEAYYKKFTSWKGKLSVNSPV